MRQPEAEPVTEDLAEYLQFAVPLCSADLAYRAEQHYPGDREAQERWLRSIIQRSVPGLNKGDALAYPPHDHRGRVTVAVAAQQIAEGVAAAGLLAGPTGITVWGAHFCPQHPCPHLIPVPMPLPVVDVHLPEEEAA